MLPSSLINKTVVITGATGGIGAAIARRFAREGANLVLTGRRQEKLRDTLSEIRQIEPFLSVEPEHQKIDGFHLDVRKMPGWQHLVEKHPKIDVLVNCAGESQRSLLVRSAEAVIEQAVQTNLLSAIYGCKVVGKAMIPQRGGCIINISSLLASKAVIGTSVYAATKAGQLGLTTALSSEFASYGIRVNAIVPGFIDTDMTEEKEIGDRSKIMAKIPLKRFGTPDEVADAAAFLAKNAYANNCILNLDGGLSAV